MALSGLSALISTSTAPEVSEPAASAESALSVLASINYSALSASSNHLAPGNERNSTLSSSASFSPDAHSSTGIPDSMDDAGDMDDDIAGLLNLTQAAAHMRPPKKTAPERPAKVPSIRLKAKKEQKVKVKPVPIAKAKPTKALKPVKSPKSKPSSARRPTEPNHSARSTEKEKPFEMEMSADSDGEGGPQIELEEFQTMFQVIAKESELATRDLRKSKTGSVEVYGEVFPAFVESLRESLALNSSDVFFDLGSGIGNVVCQIASQVGCRCYGVEIRSDLHAIAEAALDRMRKEMTLRGYRMGSVQLTNADALTQPMLLVDTTVVFLNNIGFPESMQGPLEHFFTETLPHGSRLVTLRELFPRLGPSSFENKRFSRSFATLFKHPCESFEAASGAASWTNEPVKVYIYTVDREAWAAVTYAINRPNNMMTSSIDSLRASSNSMARNEKLSPKPKKSGLSASNPGLPASSTSSHASTTPYSPTSSPHNHNDANTDPSSTSASTDPLVEADIPQLAHIVINPKGSAISPQAHFSLAGNNAQFLHALQAYDLSLLPVVSCQESPVSSFGRTGQLHLPKQIDEISLLPPTSLSAASTSREVFGMIDISVDFAFESAKSAYSWRGDVSSQRSTARSISLSQLLGCDLANPLVPIDAMMARLSDYHTRYSPKSTQLSADFKELYATSRDFESAVFDIDREQRVELRRVRAERAAKLSEISKVTSEAQTLDGDWQRDWLEVERIRSELAEMEEKLETLAKKRHAAVHQLTHLLEDESDESLVGIDLSSLIVPSQSDEKDTEEAPTPNGADDEAEANVSHPSVNNDPSAPASADAPSAVDDSDKMDISEPHDENEGEDANDVPSAPLGPLAQIRAFLDDSQRFMDDNGIEMPVMKKGAKSKLDKRFGPRPKKAAAAKASPRPNASHVEPSSEAAVSADHSSSVAGNKSNADSHIPTSPKDTSSQMQVDEADTEPEKSLAVSSNDHGRGERPRGSRHSERLSASSSALSASADRVAPSTVSASPASTPIKKQADVGAAPPVTDGSDLILRLPGEQFLRFTRPKRVINQSTPTTEPSKRVKRPGQKSLDRKQLKTALTGALSGSHDGKLSIVELRQACKDLPPFKELREKQIERKVWDALSKAQDQFKHALPTPAERKAHAMGAGKAGLWSINPKWRRTASFSALEASGQLLHFNGSSSSSASSTIFGSNSLDSEESELAAANALSAAAEEYGDDDMDFEDEYDNEDDESSSDDDDLDDDEDLEEIYANLLVHSDDEDGEEQPEPEENPAEGIVTSPIVDSNGVGEEVKEVQEVEHAQEKEEKLVEPVTEEKQDLVAAMEVDSKHDHLSADDDIIALLHADLETTAAILSNDLDTTTQAPIEVPIVAEVPQDALPQVDSVIAEAEPEDFVVEEDVVEQDEIVISAPIAPIEPSTSEIVQEAVLELISSTTPIASVEVPTPVAIEQPTIDIDSSLSTDPTSTANSKKRSRFDLESNIGTETAETVHLEAVIATESEEQIPPAKRFAPPEESLPSVDVVQELPIIPVAETEVQITEPSAALMEEK